MGPVGPRRGLRVISITDRPGLAIAHRVVRGRFWPVCGFWASVRAVLVTARLSWGVLTRSSLRCGCLGPVRGLTQKKPGRLSAAGLSEQAPLPLAKKSQTGQNSASMSVSAPADLGEAAPSSSTGMYTPERREPSPRVRHQLS